MQRFVATSDDELLLFAALASDPATQDPIDLAILNAANARSLLTALPPRITFVPLIRNPLLARLLQAARRRVMGGERGATGRSCADERGA